MLKIPDKNITEKLNEVQELRFATCYQNGYQKFPGQVLLIATSHSWIWISMAWDVTFLPGFGQCGDVGDSDGLDVTVEGETLLVPALHELDAIEGGGG